MNELISIIVPCYNVEKTIQKCISSILEQTYNCLEIIIVNDASSDKTFEICTQMKENDKRIILYNNEINKGVSASRNTGIKLAQGNYVTFIDGDDFIDQTYIEHLYNDMISNKVDIVVSNPVNCKKGKKYYANLVKEKIVCNRREALKELFREKNFFSTCWGKLYKKSIIEKSFFDISMKIGEDFKFLIDVFEQIDSMLITNVQEYNYNVLENSTIRSGFNDNWKNEINFSKNLIEGKYNNDKYLRKYVIKRYVRVNIHCLMRFRLSENDIDESINNIRKYMKEYLLCKDVSLKDKLKYIFIIYFYKLYIRFRDINKNEL